MLNKRWEKEKLNFLTMSWQKYKKWEDLPFKKSFSRNITQKKKKHHLKRSMWQVSISAMTYKADFHHF